MTVYLDNAATSWPKPKRSIGGGPLYARGGRDPGRGGYGRRRRRSVSRRDPRSAGRLFHAPDPQGVAFTLNATQAINMALKGLLKPGDHVVTSSIEHNAMWRPLKALEQRGVQVTAVPCASDGALDPADVEAALRPGTRLAAMLHGSNVLGTILPSPRSGTSGRSRGILLLVDAAQTAGRTRSTWRRWA